MRCIARTGLKAAMALLSTWHCRDSGLPLAAEGALEALQRQPGASPTWPLPALPLPAVTFRRKPANWHAKEEEAREAAAPAPSNAGLATWAFLGSLAIAVAGTIIGEAQQRRCRFFGCRAAQQKPAAGAGSAAAPCCAC